jgi:shikimate 5-dehydrogenase
MKRFGLIGHPIAHSLSPALFKAGYDGKYPYELIETADFDEAYIRFLNGYEGINVTAPFKELAYARADILSDECRIIKATNLLVKTTDGIKAYNSDYLGVRMWLMEVAEGLKRTPPTSWAPPPAARGVARFSTPPQPHSTARVLIVGTGGAGKAAAVAAASLGMDLILMNRSMEKAEAVAESVAAMDPAPAVEVRPLEDFRECFRTADIVIYNIPSAIPALAELSAEDFNPGHHKFILEANYKNPSFDKELIMKMMTANPEASCTKGTTWLLYQALTGYEIFTGEKPDLAPMSAVL